MRATLVAVLALLTFAPAAMAVDEVNTSKFREDVTVGGIMAHERALQSIANANGGTRASGTPGLRRLGRVRLAAAQEGRLQGQGAGVRLPVLPGAGRADAVAGLAGPKDYTTETYQYSGSGDVTATVQPVDVVVPIGSNPPSLDERLRGRRTSTASPPATSR